MPKKIVTAKRVTRKVTTEKRVASTIAGSRPAEAPTRSDSGPELWHKRVWRSWSALSWMWLAHPCGATSPEIMQAVEVAQLAIGVLAGSDTEARDRAKVEREYAVVLERLRLMHSASEGTTYARLEAEVRAAANNLRVVKNPELRVPLVRLFLSRIRRDLVFLGSKRRALDVVATAALLARFRERPKARRGELGARGVVAKILVLAGAPNVRAARKQMSTRLVD